MKNFSEDAVKKIVKCTEAIKFLEAKDNKIYIKSKELIKNKEELIKKFKKVNNLLRKANLLAGYDRISEFSNIFLLKFTSDNRVKNHTGILLKIE